jgi:hypothetical protein
MKLRVWSMHSLRTLHCTLCRSSQKEKQLKLILPLPRIQTFNIEFQNLQTYIALKEMHTENTNKPATYHLTGGSNNHNKHIDLESKLSSINSSAPVHGKYQQLKMHKILCSPLFSSAALQLMNSE